MARKKRWSIHELTELDISDFATLGKEERKNVVKQMQAQVKRRMENMRKKFSQNPGHFSPSYDEVSKMLNDKPFLNVDSIKTPKENKFANTYNPLAHEFSRLQTALMHKTGTWEGTLKWEREQDKMVFGTDKKGNPLHSMNEEERTLYWKVVNEYQKQKASSAERFGSNRLFEQMGAIFTKDGGSLFRDFDRDRAGLMDRLEEILEEMKGGRSDVHIPNQRGHGKPGRFSS